MLQLPDRPRVERSRPDPATSLAAILFGVAAIGLALAGILATYDWRTPAALTPLMWSLLGVFFAGVVLIVLAGVTRWVRRGNPR